MHTDNKLVRRPPATYRDAVDWIARTDFGAEHPTVQLVADLWCRRAADVARDVADARRVFAAFDVLAEK